MKASVPPTSSRSRAIAASGSAQITYQGVSQLVATQQPEPGPAGGADPVAAPPGPGQQPGDEHAVSDQRCDAARCPVDPEPAARQ